MSSSLPKPRAILFDWDNTLVDTWPLIHTAMNMTLRYMGQEEWSIEKIRGYVKKSMRDSFPELFGDRWQEAGEVYQKSYRDIHLTHLTELPGAGDMLAAIPQPQVAVGIVSNKQAVTLRKEVPEMGWDKYAQVAIGAGDAAHDKPDAAPALLALEKLGIAPGEHVWFVGDTTADLGCAQNAGLTGIFYSEQATDGKQYEGYPFHAQVRTLAELKALILVSCAG